MTPIFYSAKNCNLFLGIHDVEQGQKEAVEEAALHPHSSDPDSGEDLGPTPPDSPVPSTGAFTTHSGGLNLDDEFFAIPASSGNFLCVKIEFGLFLNQKSIFELKIGSNT